MRTVRSSSRLCSREGGAWSGGCLFLGVPVAGGGGACSGGLPWGYAWSGGASFQGVRGVVSQHTLRQTPPRGQNDRQV